jgi:predicted protein tyrosine phosphatase
MRVHILSEREATRFNPAEGKKTVMIRVQDPDSELAPLTHRGAFEDVLELFMHDLSAPIAGYPEIILFDDAMADKCLAFFEKYKDADEFVFHCVAGISRSAAIALSFFWYTGDVMLEAGILVGNSYLPNYLIAKTMATKMGIIEEKHKAIERLNPQNPEKRRIEVFSWE